MASASEKESDASCRHQKIKYIKELKQKKKKKKNGKKQSDDTRRPRKEQQ